MKTTYAVVDLETTGTNPKEDRIFQFGCVLIQEGEIVGRFATDINPDRPISKPIQHLTQVDNHQVKQAPYFEDVAETIYQLLADTVFVAHNIHFDYRFLSAELERCGLPALQLEGIDTVELAQIFLPTQVSFRLGDLAESLAFAHDMPHQADSDAEVTARLFLAIEDRMRQLPLVTMEKIAHLARVLSMHTNLYIEQVYLQMKEALAPLPETIQIVDQVAIRRQHVLLSEYQTYTKAYPDTPTKKAAWFGEALSYRPAQQALMDRVYHHFHDENQIKDCFIEAETGSGKTLGYLFPSSFVATAKEPLIISTASILLQHQLLQRDIKQVNGLTEEALQATVMKSHKHYLDLERFKQTLTQPSEMKQYTLFQMMVLVWLTETTTGDLDELNLLRLDHLFFTQVTHRGLDYLSERSAFYAVDFLRLAYQRMEQSNVIIVNHAFLVQESLRTTPILPQSRYLLIDEAHHLPRALERVATQTFDHYACYQVIQQLKEFEFPEIVAEKVQLFQQILTQLEDTNLAVAEALVDMRPPRYKEWILDERARAQFSVPTERLIQRLLQTFADAITVQSQLREVLVAHLAAETLGTVDTWFAALKQGYEACRLFFTTTAMTHLKRIVFGQQLRYMTYETIDLARHLVTDARWYARYERIVYVGATLTVKQEPYIPKQLGLENAPVYRLPAQFDYATQAELFVVTDAPTADKTQQLIVQLRALFQTYPRSILVLFTSHEQLQAVYEALHFEFLQAGREILAQGIGGSRQKLLKRFARSERAILFGADSFWEGVDLPGDQLSLLVVTKLPFDNPQRPLVKAKYAYLDAMGHNAFQEEALPKAAMKLRQGFGRLIRSTTDRGMMLVLDPRLHTSRYHQFFLQSLPQDLPIKTGQLSEALTEITSFFQD